MLPWLAAEKPDIFNAYQQTQPERVEAAMSGAKFVASFIGREGGNATFVGLYAIRSAKPVTREEFWQMPAHVELGSFGMRGFGDHIQRQAILLFD